MPRAPPQGPPKPQFSRGAAWCPVGGTSCMGSVVLKCFLSASSQCELCKGICMSLALESTDRFQKEKGKSSAWLISTWRQSL